MVWFGIAALSAAFVAIAWTLLGFRLLREVRKARGLVLQMRKEQVKLHEEMMLGMGFVRQRVDMGNWLLLYAMTPESTDYDYQDYVLTNVNRGLGPTKQLDRRISEMKEWWRTQGGKLHAPKVNVYHLQELREMASAFQLITPMFHRQLLHTSGDSGGPQEAESEVRDGAGATASGAGEDAEDRA